MMEDGAVGTEEAVLDATEDAGAAAAHVEHLAVGLHVGVVATVHPLGAGEGSVGNPKQNCR